MVDFRKLENYELNEADIDKAIHILSVFSHKDATPEEAIDFLEWLRVGVHEMAHDSEPKKLEELYKQYTEEKKKK